MAENVPDFDADQINKVANSERFQLGKPGHLTGPGADVFQIASIMGGGSNNIQYEQLLKAKRAAEAAGNEADAFETAKKNLLGLPTSNPSQVQGDYVLADDPRTGGKSMQFVRQNESMHAIQDMLGKFFQFQGDRSKPLQQDLALTSGMGFSGATSDNIMQLLAKPDSVPNADNIPGSISNLNPAYQDRARQFRTFIEGMPVTAVKELRHPRHMYEGVPRDPLINMIHLDSQRRRVENFYAFV